MLINLYDATPGGIGAVPVRLPASSAPQTDRLPRLMLFVHPRCPCSHASLRQLQQLLDAYPESFQPEVWLVKPPEAPADWDQGARDKISALVPAAPVFCDEGGTRARSYGARTSGHALLYTVDGQLLFSGGITALRGHEGPNAGERAIAALLTGETASRASTPVFGCPLFSAEQVPQNSDASEAALESDGER